MPHHLIPLDFIGKDYIYGAPHYVFFSNLLLFSPFLVQILPSLSCPHAPLTPGLPSLVSLDNRPHISGTSFKWLEIYDGKLFAAVKCDAIMTGSLPNMTCKVGRRWAVSFTASVPSSGTDHFTLKQGWVTCTLTGMDGRSMKGLHLCVDVRLKRRFKSLLIKSLVVYNTTGFFSELTSDSDCFNRSESIILRNC